jgi:hypothetical protein
MHGQSSQSGMFPFGTGQSSPPTDPRSNMMNQGVAPGMNFNNLTRQQRQLFFQQQNMRSNTGVPSASTLTNQQQTQAQQAYLAAQERLRLEHQQRMSHTQLNTSPGSDIGAFPVLRSNPPGPGVVRTTRSPSETGGSPMIPRAPITQDDYQRLLQAPQQGQGPNFMQGNPNWQQTQVQQTTQMGQNPGSMYGMAPPGNTSHSGSYGGAPSPGSSHSWSQGGIGQYSFPSSNHPQSLPDVQQTSASSTPLTQQHQQLQPPSNNLVAEQQQPAFDEFFNWA